MSYNSNLPEDITVSRADVRENLRALKEDKIVDAATAVTAESAAKLTTARTISLEGNATGSTTFDGSADVAIQVDVLSADTAAVATKLETARTINGVEFDGSKDITIAVPTMPIGSVIMWPFSTLPGGDDEGKWLECNGQSTDGYPELAAIAGATVPDYQGYFLRGLGGNSADLGVKQGDAIRNITGTTVAHKFATWVGPTICPPDGAFSYKNMGGSDYTVSTVSPKSTDNLASYFDASKVVPTADENRPINKAVIYLIKAKQ
ncbi:MAG: hypothetical protein H6Q70_2781 [Firmicutes bacterium]|nr:hypothetical protein [Bacillota bacterium]